MNKTPYNPGLSDEAWKNLHVLIARLSIKYAGTAAKGESKVLPRKRPGRSSSVAN
ncbi:hypothetical protein [Paenibacillus cineris]|uniref:hypothetical protein n=1 Tax=Paenibacillus cineris TaxID=237530 RepID=UPI001B2213C3|nr:hypothetical protein [Paenibacillus cineris]GIO63535.1 hypothetical protein J43TS9_51090 [Paenibacillus cineris]